MLNLSKCPLFNGGNQQEVSNLSQDEASFERFKAEFQMEEDAKQIAFIIGLFQQAIVFYETTPSEIVDQLLEQLDGYKKSDEFWLANHDVVLEISLSEEEPLYYIKLSGIPLDSKVVRMPRVDAEIREKILGEAERVRQELSDLNSNDDFEITVRHSNKDDDNDEDQDLAVVPR